MSRQEALIPVDMASDPPVAPTKPRGFVYHAKIISLLTLASRILGVVRESFAAKYFGAGMVSSAFAFAFTIPNLFRRLFGEGALSAAFIPLYAQALKEGHDGEARRFASATVNLLFLTLAIITLVGEAILFAISLADMAPDRRLALRLTMVMLPYVLFVCGAAFLGAILQVHKRFGMTAAAPIVLNVALIAATVLGAWLYGTRTTHGQIRAIYFVSYFVLAAGLLQILMLLRS
jgi:putative peptidoglycan lipid II flippase